MHILLKSQIVLPNSLWKPVVLCNPSALALQERTTNSPAESLYWLWYLHMKYIYYHFTIFSTRPSQFLSNGRWRFRLVPSRPHHTHILSAPPFSWYNFVILVGSMLIVDITENLYKPYLQLSQDIYYDLLFPSSTTLLSLKLTIFCLLTWFSMHLSLIQTAAISRHLPVFHPFHLELTGASCPVLCLFLVPQKWRCNWSAFRLPGWHLWRCLVPLSLGF